MCFVESDWVVWFGRKRRKMKRRRRKEESQLLVYFVQVLRRSDK
jgi:hypothetical protein